MLKQYQSEETRERAETIYRLRQQGHGFESTDKRGDCPLDLRLQAEVCARNLYDRLDIPR